MSQPRRKVAIIGLGMAVTPHAQSLKDLEERVEVVAGFSPSAARREAFAKKFGMPVVDDLQAILGNKSIEAVLLLTPPNTHADLAGKLAAAGKHILMEKPVEASPAQARALVEACEKAGVKLGVVFQHRFRPGALALRAIIQAGRLGRIAAANVHVPWWRPQGYYDEPGRGTLSRDGGGVLITQAIHVLDLFLSLTGGVAEVAAFSATTSLHKMESEDYASAALRLSSGGIGALMATTAAYPGFAERIELIGERGTALLAAGQLEVHFHDGAVEKAGESGASGGGADPMAFANDAHRAVLADFLDALDEGRQPQAHGREALKVHALIEAVLRSARDGVPARVA
jgi:predicted dehydrogenase